MANEPNTFVVEGNGPFPWDMLRYDGAYPSRERDTGTMRCSHERRAVKLCSRRPPTVKRWRSHGWRWRSQFSWKFLSASERA